MVLRTLKIPEVPNEVGLNIKLLETLGGGGGESIFGVVALTLNYLRPRKL